MSIAIRLQELRKKNADSQEQLAEKPEVSRQAVSKWESGQGSPGLNNLVKISEVYDVSLDYLVKGISEENDRVRAAVSISNTDFGSRQRRIPLFPAKPFPATAAYFRTPPSLSGFPAGCKIPAISRQIPGRVSGSI